MMKTSAAFAMVVMLHVADGLLAQAPPRDRSEQAATGTAGIRGRVVGADTGAPLRRAHVQVSSYELRVERIVNTDEDGRFQVADLPAGSYYLSVTRNGYASLQFGQQQPFGPGRQLTLANGQFIDRVDFALPRAGVITGRVSDQLGEPVPGVLMQALRPHYLPGGERHLMPVNMAAFTNDLGEFRLFGLMPGTYMLSANPNDHAIGDTPSASGVGEHPSSDGRRFATTFYPGTPSGQQAEPIRVTVDDVANVSFALSMTRLIRVSGIVRDSHGRPVTAATFRLSTRTPNSERSSFVPLRNADGRFSVDTVAPGDHTIEIVPLYAGFRTAADSEFDEVASVTFTAAGQDITDLVITTAPGATVTGRVIFDGRSKARRPDRVVAVTPDHRATLVHREDSGDGAVDASGRFQLRGIIGRAVFTTRFADWNTREMGWSVKSVTLNGNDITYTPIEIPSAGEISGIEITLTDAVTQLSGIVTNARGEAVKDCVVVVLPQQLKEGRLSGYFTRTAPPNQNGRYEITGLPAGDYIAVALDAFESGTEWDPAFRKRVEPAATRFRLSHGQAATLNLELMP